jgi:hypothetical protein
MGCRKIRVIGECLFLTQRKFIRLFTVGWVRTLANNWVLKMLNGTVEVSALAQLHDERLDPSTLEVMVEHYSIPAWPTGEPEIVFASTIQSTKIHLPDQEHLLVSCLNPSTHKVWRIPKNRQSGLLRLASTEWAVVLPNDEENLDFLNAAMESLRFQFQMNAYVTGTTNSHQRVKKNDFLRLELPNLSQSERSIIGRIHKGFRERHSLIQKENMGLRKYAEALFWGWFISNAPLHSNNGQPETRTIKLKTTEYGNLPESWTLQPISSTVKIRRGFSYSGDSLCSPDDGTKMVNLASVEPGGGYKVAGLKFTSADVQSSFLLRHGDVLLATVDLTPDLRVVGSPIIAPTTHEGNAIYSQDLLRLSIPNDSWLSRGFLFHWLKVHRGFLRMWSSGTTVSRFPIAALDKFMIARPDKERLKVFDEIYEKTLALCEANDRIREKIGVMAEAIIEPLLHSEKNACLS